MPLSKSVDRLAQEALDSPTCFCGRPKVAKKQTVCAACWRRLPRNLQFKVMRAGLGDYGSVYDEVTDWLRINA